MPQGERGRFKLRGEVGAMTVGDFDALPPELRFYAGGDRSLRGFDYHEIGEVNAQWQHHRRQIPRRRQRRVRVLLQRRLGRGACSSTRAMHSPTRFSVNVGAGVGVRWRSPLGPDPRGRRVSGADAICRREISWRLHVLLGPDI